MVLPDLSQYSDMAVMLLIVLVFVRLIERILESKFELFKPKVVMDGIEDKFKVVVDNGIQVIVKDIENLSQGVKDMRNEVDGIRDSVVQHGTRLTRLETEHDLYHNRVKEAK